METKTDSVQRLLLEEQFHIWMTDNKIIRMQGVRGGGHKLLNLEKKILAPNEEKFFCFFLIH